MKIQSNRDYKFTANQVVKITKGYFKGCSGKIEGCVFIRDMMLIPWSEKHETYKVYIQDYGYQYFLPDALEAIPETVAGILGGLNLKIDAQFERKDG